MRFIHLLVSLPVVALAGCDACLDKTPPGALVVHPLGRDISFRRMWGTWQLYYRMDAPHPAEPVLSHIREALASQGWQALRDDHLNPGLPSSHEIGWTSFGDETSKPATKVHRWMGWWKNADEDVLVYILAYRYPEHGPPDLNTLRMHAVYTPKWVDRARSAEMATYNVWQKLR
jgi:hypothetical protein